MLVHSLLHSCFRYPNPALTPRQIFPIIIKADDHGDNGRKAIQAPEMTTTNNTSYIDDRQAVDISRVPSGSSVLALLPPKAHETYVVYTKIEKLSRHHNVPYGFVNRTSWRPQRDPPRPVIGLPKSQWDRNQFSIVPGRGVWVDLVVNNLDEGSHPFHLVGRPFHFLFP